jgi:hypothetical protein
VGEAARGLSHPQSEGHRNMKFFYSRGRIAPLGCFAAQIELLRPVS